MKNNRTTRLNKLLTNILKYLLFNGYLITLFLTMYEKKHVYYLQKCVLYLRKEIINEKSTSHIILFLLVY